MKTLIPLIISTVITSLSWAQNPVRTHMNTFNYRSIRIETDTPIDHGSGGPDMLWDFTNVTSTGDIWYDAFNSSPSAEQIAAYPETSTISTRHYMDSMNEHVFYKGQGFEEPPLLIATTDDYVNLHYNVDSASIIPVSNPLNYGETHSDTVAGTYNFEHEGTTYSGNFNGNLESSVDAYGSLTYKLSNGANTQHFADVTRLKTVQTIAIDYMGIPNAGTITKTNYSYAIHNSYFIYWSTITNISIPSLGLNIEHIKNDGFDSEWLSLKKHHVSKFITLTPNPVQSELKITTAPDIIIQSLEIYNIQGQMVWQGPYSRENKINLAHLEAGIYLLKAGTSAGIIVKRLIID